jgi:hypothetical protein
VERTACTQSARADGTGGREVDVRDRGPGPDRTDPRPTGRVDQLVHVSLARREAARGGIGTGHVAVIEADLGARIHQDEALVRDPIRVVHVVQDTRVGAAPHDGVEPGARRTCRAEGRLDGGFDLPFPRAWGDP